jgi:hypothetical protein
MQNKANVKMGKMTISTATIKAYANKQRAMNNEHYSKQTQSNPISNDQSQIKAKFKRRNSLLCLPDESLPPIPVCSGPASSQCRAGWAGHRIRNSADEDESCAKIC